MVINRSHIKWAVLVAFLTGISILLYIANFHPELTPYRLPAIFGPTPPTRNTVGGTPLGLIFGIAALAIFLFASALGIRKKRRLWPIGNVKSWLRAHIWLTILTIPLVLLHSGFRLGGPMTTLLIILYCIVMGSGFFGLAMQQYLPKMMTAALPREVVFEEIPYIRKKLVDDADKAPIAKEMVGESHGGGVAVAAAPAAIGADESSRQVLSKFMIEDCFPYLRARRGGRHRLADPMVCADTFRLLELSVTEKWKDRVYAMQQWCEDRRLLDLQTKFQYWLHGWLLFHVPVSFALLVVTFWHAYVTVLFLK